MSIFSKIDGVKAVTTRNPIPISSFNVVIDVSESLYQYAKQRTGKTFDPNTPRVTETERLIIERGHPSFSKKPK